MTDHVKKIIGKAHVNKAITILINKLVPFETQYKYYYDDEWIVVLHFTDKHGEKRAMKIVDNMMVNMVQCAVE